jgi:uncharacterized repeat protein (TIGR01451 family)
MRLTPRSSLLVVLLTLAALLAVASPALAAPPSNDDFADAEVIAGNGGSVKGWNVDATGETDEPDHAEVADPIQSAWYSWTAPSSEDVTFRTCVSSFDTALAAYTGASVGALTEVASNDDSDSETGVLECGFDDTGSEITFLAIAATAYHIAVDGFEDEEGLFTLAWAMDGTGPDAFPGQVITGSSGDVTSSTTGATGQTDESNHAGGADSIESVWYSWTAPSTGTVFLAVCVANFNTVLAVYTGSAVDDLTAEADADDECGPEQEASALTFDAVAATVYRIAVDGAAEGDGMFTLAWSYVVPGADDFADAQVITGPGGQVTSTNTGATGETDEPPNEDPDATLESIWYSWTPDADGLVFFHTCNSDFDTTLGAYTGPAVDDLTVIDQDDDDGCYERQSGVSFDAVAGTAYHISVDGFGSNAGTFTLAWEQVVPVVEVGADLEAEVDDSADPVPAGSTVVYNARAENNGPAQAEDVTLKLQLPAQGKFVSASPEQGTCGAPVNRFVSCTIGAIPPGEAAEIDVTMVMTHTGTYSLGLVELMSSTPDPVQANNTSREMTTVTNNTTVVPGASCTIVGTNGADNLPGGTGNDTICLLGGADVSDGRGGNDRIIGGGGGDTLTGGAGGDTLEGGDANDTLKAKDGVSGNDAVHGGAGANDVCTRDPGDTVTGCP